MARALRGDSGPKLTAIPETAALAPGIYCARLEQGGGARLARIVLPRRSPCR
ncbi:MAG TPA: hypothetical protein VMH61_07480 [Candidatus Acidoferrales bacterium]|nr:hypothetical protein [Candidatus Acidoferrales bacterium]